MRLPLVRRELCVEAPANRMARRDSEVLHCRLGGSVSSLISSVFYAARIPMDALAGREHVAMVAHEGRDCREMVGSCVCLESEAYGTAYSVQMQF
jgi:hypothetical protein